MLDLEIVSGDGGGQVTGRGHLNDLEQMVLATAISLEGEAFGGAVYRELRRTAPGRFARAAVYVAIDRLVEKGMIRAGMGESAPGRGGRPRRYLTVTPEGRAALDAEIATWKRLWAGMEPSGS